MEPEARPRHRSRAPERRRSDQCEKPTRRPSDVVTRTAPFAIATPDAAGTALLQIDVPRVMSMAVRPLLVGAKSVVPARASGPVRGATGAARPPAASAPVVESS